MTDLAFSIWSRQIRPLAVGTMIVAAFYTLWNLRKSLVAGIGKAFGDIRSGTVAEGGELFLGSGQDTLRQIIHMKGMTERDPRPAFSQGWANRAKEGRSPGAVK